MVGIGSRMISLLAIALPLAVCAATPATDGIRKELAPTGTLRAAINYNNPLLARRDPASGELRGLAVDLSRELAHRLGLPLKLLPYEAAGEITDSATGNVWDVAYLGIDPLRAKDIAFTAAYIELEGTYLVPAGSPLMNTDDLDRDGARIAVTAHSAYDLFLTRELHHAQLVRAENTPKSVELMLAQQLDAVAAVRTALIAAAKQLPGSRVLSGHFMTIPQAAGVPQGRSAAARYLGEFIEEMKATGFVANELKKYGFGPDDAIVANEARSSPTATVKRLPPRPGEACCGYPYPRETDAEVVDGDVHRVLYLDAHVMFVEVSNPPLLHVKMHGHPFSSVFANDSTPGARDPEAPNVPPDQINRQIDPNSPYNEAGGTRSGPPAGLQWPTCMPAAPQSPHEGPFNTGMAPNHFYRLEFLRAEGDDYKTHWKEWYPEMARPVKPVADFPTAPTAGPRISEQWPYPITYDSIFAAPNNYKLLFEDGKMRLLEVTVHSGEVTPMHGNPYPAVLAYNGNAGNASLITATWLDPKSPLNGKAGGHSGPPNLHDLTSPTCETVAPVSPHRIHNGSAVPLHYYRIEFKRIDGDQLSAKWKTWYPWMQYLHFMR